jgi:ABC-type branched-subunit amino acid transport system permease subunit
VSSPVKAPVWPVLAGAILCSSMLGAIVAVEDQRLIVAMLLGFAAIWFAARRWGAVAALERSAEQHPGAVGGAILVAALAGIALLHEDNFGFLMISTVLLFASCCIGLTIQLGYAGVSNFGAAGFVGAGAYTAAVLNWLPWMPDLLALIGGGVAAVLVGSLLLLPVLRTRGHYAALTTLAFGIMFGVFLDATPIVGGPQGLKLSGVNLFGWDFSNDIRLGSFLISFYANYVLLSLAIFGVAIFVASRLDRSWVGIWLDTVRLDETACAVFGVNIGFWKILAFTAGNFLAGLAGATYAKMLGFIAPNNFTLSDSLMLVSVVILGGIGNRWGALPATAILVLLPEKLQFIQEYRLLIFAVLVVIILMASPAGLVPRRTRRLDPHLIIGNVGWLTRLVPHARSVPSPQRGEG